MSGVSAADEEQRRRDERFMRMALAEAARAADYGEVPIGAVVVKDGEVVARSHNWRETWRDPTAHAEILAIREAARRLGGWRLDGCELYVTLEPCPMCAGALMQARVQRLIYGASDPKAGAIASKLELLVPGRWNHHPQITAGILAEECGNILKDFFRNLRGQSAADGEEGGANT
ncbi:MAG: nucleoside deaminase [Thermoflavifilum sp.]|nr:nucleoside deaminase [Thermoflavifilum sp.]MCL6514672.1 tRNA adenosine(34) deaminase TadA [Alicyclobacillus sp.]